tara:strand:- start:12569 stop:12733 length:165 start_codon:yes stop_codon:yes gene_type:complete
MLTKRLKAPAGHHWMKKGKFYKLMRYSGKFKPHRGASLTAVFKVQKSHVTEKKS